MPGSNRSSFPIPLFTKLNSDQNGKSQLERPSELGRCVCLLFLGIVTGIPFSTTAPAQAVIVQISDTHLCSSHAPHAATNLTTAVQMINRRTVDSVIVSGDMGESSACRLQAKAILANLKVPVHYVPGNHDVHTLDVSTYRSVFGSDYYRFQVKNVDVIVVDSQLLGNYDNYAATTPPPLPAYTQAQSTQMLNWMKSLVGIEQQALAAGRVVVAVQHIPVARNYGFPPDTKPYWVISDPYRTLEMNALRALGVKTVLAGHWHSAKIFDWGNITWHTGPSTSWLPWGGTLGFAVHTITAAGTVLTQFVDLPNAVP
jgi:3',5'-cyclic AMP phosphodiesterase CpdA